MEKYNKQFYETLNSSRSAREIIPIVLELINLKSVVDVGCGVGDWLSVFKNEFNIKNIFGIDYFVEKSLLKIPMKDFYEMDLLDPKEFPFACDLVMCLEVAEHLKEENADKLIDFLVSLADVILFSSAIPYQGGTNHINEQFLPYWIKKFKERDYYFVDCIRKKIWSNEKVSYFYAQNMVLFVKKSVFNKNKKLKQKFTETELSFVSLVHPKRYIMLGEYKEKVKRFIPNKLIKLINRFQ